MSRMEEITLGTEVSVSEEFKNDPDIQLWLKMGRLAMFFCLWVAIALPVLLVISIRF
jgi:hypothetical protein